MVGHTDRAGSNAYNVGLSERRAQIGAQITALQQLLQIEQPLEEGDVCPGLVTLQIVADLGKQGLQTKIGPAFFIEGEIVNHA